MNEATMNRLSHGARSLKLGYTFDPEDSRRTRRLQDALVILRDMGVVSRVEHDAPQPYPGSEGCAKHPANSGKGMQYLGYCSDRCKTMWSPWVTDEMFELAWTAADATATLRGVVTNAQAAAKQG